MKCLAVFRKEKQLTTKEMAKEIGISQSLYEKVEFGNRYPSRFFMERFKKKYPDFDMNIFFDELLHNSCI